MKTKCKICGAVFTVSKHVEELFDDGHIECPDICLDCLERMEYANYNTEYEQYSDADLGL